MMTMLDTDGDGNISLTEMLVMSRSNAGDEDPPSDTNVFNHNDFNGNGMLNLSELTLFMTHLDDLDPSYCYEVKAGDNVMEDGELWEYGESSDECMKMDLEAGEAHQLTENSAPRRASIPEMLRFMV